MIEISKIQYQKPKTHTQKCKNGAVINTDKIIVFECLICVFNIWFLIFHI